MNTITSQFSNANCSRRQLVTLDSDISSMMIGKLVNGKKIRKATRREIQGGGVLIVGD